MKPAPGESAASNEALADDPLELGSLGDDPLGLGDTSAATSGRQLAPTSTRFATKASPPNKPRRTPKRKHQLTNLDIAAVIMSIVHFVFHLTLLAISFRLRTDTAPETAVIQPDFIRNLELIVRVIQWGASIGILIGGIGVLARQDWAPKIGYPF